MNRRRRIEYSEALSSLKRWNDQTRPEDWTDEEWRTLVRKAAAQKPDNASSVRPRPALLRPLVSAATSLAVLVWAVIFLSAPGPQSDSALRAEGGWKIASTTPPTPNDHNTASAQPASPTPADRTLLASAAGAVRPTADKPAFTWISPDTGLQIVWFTNNNLNLEDHQ
jgi:hypothetical protein